MFNVSPITIKVKKTAIRSIYKYICIFVSINYGSTRKAFEKLCSMRTSDTDPERSKVAQK